MVQIEDASQQASWCPQTRPLKGNKKMARAAKVSSPPRRRTSPAKPAAIAATADDVIPDEDVPDEALEPDAVEALLEAPAPKRRGRARRSTDDAVTPQLMKSHFIRLGVIGRSPLLFHRKDDELLRELTLPALKAKKDVDRLVRDLKHNPLQEYRDSVYETGFSGNPTLLQFPAAAFHRAMASAAMDMPGMAKSEVGRRTWDHGVPLDGVNHTPETLEMVNIYGKPYFRMDVVKNFGYPRVPDVRFKACLKEWCCTVEVHYIHPLLNEQTCVNVLSNAGMMIGIGDGRQERGILSLGQFFLVDTDHPEFRRIQKEGGRAVQEAAMNAAVPEFYDVRSEKMFFWFDNELENRRQAGGTREIETREPEMVEE
jgi:hypothetical protein